MVDDEGRIVMRLEQARAYRGISGAELARRVGVDRKRLWRVLNGERAMRVRMVSSCPPPARAVSSFSIVLPSVHASGPRGSSTASMRVRAAAK